MIKNFTIDKVDYSKNNLSYTLFQNIQAIFNGNALNFNRADFRGSKFINCRFSNNDFDRSDLIDCYIEDVTFDNVNFGMALIKNNYFKRVMFFKNNYDDLSVQETTFVDCTFDEKHINWTLFNCTFKNCTFKSTAFNHSSIDSNKFIDCCFIKCNMAECHMENIKFQSCLLDHVELGVSYISSYLFRDTNLSQIVFKYRGDMVNINYFDDDDLNELISQERYFNYLNMLLLLNKTDNFFKISKEIIEKTLKLETQQRTYNLKNILLMFEFYHDSTLIDFVTYQKIVIYLNALNFDNINFDESLEYKSILYRINEKNDISKVPIDMLNTIDCNENCIFRIHINSDDLVEVKSQLSSVFDIINEVAINRFIKKDDLYEIRRIEQGSIILTIASSLILSMLFVKVIKSINHSIQIMRIEKVATDKNIEIIKKAKTSKQVQKIIKEVNECALATEKNYDKTVSKLKRSILIGQIISIVIGLTF